MYDFVSFHGVGPREFDKLGYDDLDVSRFAAKGLASGKDSLATDGWLDRLASRGLCLPTVGCGASGNGSSECIVPGMILKSIVDIWLNIISPRETSIRS
jgi:hypothetical protein